MIGDEEGAEKGRGRRQREEERRTKRGGGLTATEKGERKEAREKRREWE